VLVAENSLGIGVEQELGGIKVAALVGAEVTVNLVTVDHILELEVGRVGISISSSNATGGFPGREKDMPDVASFVPERVELYDFGSPTLQLIPKFRSEKIRNGRW
jgi:hypothetical protein